MSQVADGCPMLMLIPPGLSKPLACLVPSPSPVLGGEKTAAELFQSIHNVVKGILSLSCCALRGRWCGLFSVICRKAGTWAREERRSRDHISSLLLKILALINISLRGNSRHV